MRQLCIAHLSDLHIGPNQTPAINRVRENLLDDLHKLVNDNKLTLDCVAVTGDIVDHGGSEIHYELASAFFKQLSIKLDVPLEAIAFVPGNHDIPRRKVITELARNNKFETFSFQSKQEYEETWETLDVRFKEYYKFVNGLVPGYCKYQLGAGIRNIRTASGIAVQFLLLNSSWLTTGENDYGNIGIGRWQLENLRERKNEFGNPDITFAMLHHPLNWLNVQDKDDVTSFLRDKTLIKSEVILHGHIHDGGIDISTNPDGSILTLVSGIGYPEGKGTSKASRCRYALYNFDLDHGETEVWLRHTDDNGHFAADTLLYKAAKETGKLKIKFSQGERLEPLTNTLEVDPIPIVSDWVGRIDELNQLLDPKIKLVSITGVGGQGKTALAAEFLRRFTRGSNPAFQFGLWVNCRELPDSLHVKIIQLLEFLSGGKESATLYRDEKLDDTIKRFLRNLQSQKTLIVFDNIDAYVQGETESPLWELHPIVEMILNTHHNSLVVLTCRPPLNHPNAAFRHIQLQGLSVEDGVELFQKRGISLVGDNSIDYCKSLVTLTSGHPWWLGLIAGQVQSGKDNLKNCVQKFSLGEITPKGRIKEYFKSVWDKLNKQRQKILRHLVESARPLTVAEIMRATEESGYASIQKDLRRLIRLGLMEPHEDSTSGSTVYYVHPLVREFVHETYTVALQKQYVFRVLRIFLPKEIINMLNRNLMELDDIDNIALSIPNVIDSVETCLNSRNAEEALALLMQFQSIIIDGGRHHSFCSLTCQALDALNWNQVQLLTMRKGVELVENHIDLLVMIGEINKANYYLNMFESFVEPDSAAHLGYLLLMAYTYWLQGKFKEVSAPAIKCRKVAI